MPKFQFAHNNLNVADMARATEFYEQALGLHIDRRIDRDGFSIAFLSDGASAHKLELTWLKDHEGQYDLGENEIHLCFTTDDYDAALAMHKEMGCVCYENAEMGLYFIEDPDGYWTEIIPVR